MKNVTDATHAQGQTSGEDAMPKRRSLKEIARRVSSVPPMPESTMRTQLDSMRPVSVSNCPPPASHPAFNDLAKICEAAQAQPEARLSPTVPIVASRPKPAKKSSALPIFGGIAVAAVAIGLSIVVVTRAPASSPAVVVAVAAEPVVAVAAQPAVIAATPAKEEAAEPAAVEPAAERGETTTSATPAPAKNAIAPKTDATPAKVDDTKTDDTKTDTTEEAAKAPVADGDLSGAMANAVGAGAAAKQDDTSAASTPAPGSVPLTPSQGQVQSALANVRGAARGCVAGMEEASRASVTFGSSGRVSSVSVSGPAATKPAAACIRAALKDARVPAFQNPSFSVGLTIRP